MRVIGWVSYMTKRKRTVITIGIVILVAGVYLWFFGFQTGCALTVRYSFRNTPDVKKVPLPLVDSSVSTTPHNRVSYFGYELELPWDDVDDQKSKTRGQIHITVFRSGNAFWFSTFPPRVFVSEVMKTNAIDPQRFKQIFGSNALNSDYAFESEYLQMTPQKITPFVSSREAAAGAILLLIKGISMPAADSGIFWIRAPGFQGFQFENPQNRPPKITDELYSNDGGIDVMFFQKPSGTAPSISQAEINRVIQSIHKVSIPTLTSDASGNGQ